MARSDDKKSARSLDKAKEDLAEIRGRPFDVDKILAERRAKEERDRKKQQAAKEKLEKTIRAARERRHAIRARELEMENRVLEKNKTVSRR